MNAPPWLNVTIKSNYIRIKPGKNIYFSLDARRPRVPTLRFLFRAGYSRRYAGFQAEFRSRLPTRSLENHPQLTQLIAAEREREREREREWSRCFQKDLSKRLYFSLFSPLKLVRGDYAEIILRACLSLRCKVSRDVEINFKLFQS